jgi:hypothetical protein
MASGDELLRVAGAQTYRDLLLSYFKRSGRRQPGAGELRAAAAFFSDLPITKAVEIHVEPD